VPTCKLLPFTVNDADAIAPVPESAKVADPSDWLPSMNATVPAGALVPLTAVTFAVNCVVPPCGMLAEFAVSVVDVPTPAGALAHLVTRL
jgi:hypothetical protein